MASTMSFWLLVVVFTRLANFLVVEIDELDLDASGFTTCFVVENRDDLGEYVRLVQELPLDSARSHGYFRMSTEQFLTMFWGWWEHTFHVYQLYTWQCTRRDARRRIYDVVRSVNAALIHSSRHIGWFCFPISSYSAYNVSDLSFIIVSISCSH